MTARIIFALACALVWVSGCSDGARGPQASDQIQLMLLRLAESAKEASEFQQQFAEDAAPPEADRLKYTLLAFHPVDLKLESKTGAVKVLIQDLEGHKVGDAEWTVVKEKGAWKLKHAPLP